VPSPLGLYVHVPYCRQRCSYCDFYFVTGDKSPAPFLAAVQQEIAHYAERYAERSTADTIYIGGGTPSRLPLDDTFTLLDSLRTSFNVTDPLEVTFEVNPDDCTDDYLAGLRALGVDRLSLGVQSFFDDDLRWMNRAHTADQAVRAIEGIHKAGFRTFSADLIMGLPDQPEEYWQANVEKAVRLGVPHLSTYMLTVEEQTPLGNQVRRGLVTPATDDTFEARFRFTMDYLRAQGFEHYEISSFARPGHRAVHNHRYWDHVNYLGFGPSAHSFWWDTALRQHAAASAGAERWSNLRHLNRYNALLEGHTLPVEERQRLSLDQLANEHLMLRLRTEEGVDLDRLLSVYGVDLVMEKVDDLAALEEAGMIALRGGRMRLTDDGKMLADAVTERLMLRDAAPPRR